MRRTALTVAARAMGLIVAGLLVLPLVLSLAPSNAAKAARSQHDVGSLMPGDFRFDAVRHREAWPGFWNARGEPAKALVFQDWSGEETHVQLLLLRDWSGQLHAYTLLMRDGRVRLPDPHWWFMNPHLQCERFGPQTDADGKLLRDGIVTCHDEAFRTWYGGSSPWRWAYDGRSLDERYWVAPLMAADVEIDGDTLYVNH